MASVALFACLFAVLINVVVLLPYDDRYDHDYRYNDYRYFNDYYDGDRYYADRYYGGGYSDGRYDDRYDGRYYDGGHNEGRYYDGGHNDGRYYDGGHHEGRYYDGGHNEGRSSECRNEFEYFERCPENVCYKDCRDVKDPPSYCPERSSNCHGGYPRCLCIEGYYRNEHGRCVPYNDCWDNYSRQRSYWYY